MSFNKMKMNKNLFRVTKEINRKLIKHKVISSKTSNLIISSPDC